MNREKEQVATREAEIRRHLDEFVALCRAEGVRPTHQRLEVYRDVLKSRAHPDAEAVFRRVRRRVPTISLDTVYRTLALLEELGLIKKVGEFGGRSRFDGETRPHSHFVCESCGRVLDVEGAAVEGRGFEEVGSKVGKVKSVRVVFEGVCNGCFGER